MPIWGANDDNKWKMTGFYGSPESRNRNESWRLLQDLDKDQSLSWLVCGDFNEIIYSYEKKEGALRNEKRMEEFQRMLSDCQLEDLGFEGPWFTWEQGILSHNNIREKLDRGVAKSAWWINFPNVVVRHLPHFFSNIVLFCCVRIKERGVLGILGSGLNQLGH